MRLFIMTICFAMISIGCARYESKSPIQQQEILPTRYSTNVNEDNPSYTNNTNYISNTQRTAGIRIEKRIAQQIKATYPEVRDVTVVLVRNRAYVAITLRRNQLHLGQMRVEIPSLVKSLDGSVERVYVSSSPNFREMVNRYLRSR
jgi:YhcN/YlaJ family sporulation lipoprotein